MVANRVGKILIYPQYKNAVIEGLSATLYTEGAKNRKPDATNSSFRVTTADIAADNKDTTQLCITLLDDRKDPITDLTAVDFKVTVQPSDGKDTGLLGHWTLKENTYVANFSVANIGTYKFDITCRGVKIKTDNIVVRGRGAQQGSTISADREISAASLKSPIKIFIDAHDKYTQEHGKCESLGLHALTLVAHKAGETATTSDVVVVPVVFFDKSKKIYVGYVASEHTGEYDIEALFNKNPIDKGLKVKVYFGTPDKAQSTLTISPSSIKADDKSLATIVFAAKTKNKPILGLEKALTFICLLYTSPSPRD